MHRERIRQLADLIENVAIPNLGFNMESWLSGNYDNADHSGHNCGTTACIAGWAVHMANKEEKPLKSSQVLNVESKAKQFLELGTRMADELFTMTNSSTGLRSGVTNKEAAKVLRNLADKGVVDWSIVGH